MTRKAAERVTIGSILKLTKAWALRGEGYLYVLPKVGRKRVAVRAHEGERMVQIEYRVVKQEAKGGAV